MNKMIKNNELIHRLKMVQDDVLVLLEHLELGNSMDEPTKVNDTNGYTHLYNINIALDILDNECLSWNKYEHKNK